MIDKQRFLEIIESAPLVSIDLIIENHEGRILLGKRLNQPAKGSWFVPGGRVRKNEKLADAFKRITVTELGIELDFNGTHLVGAFNHIYDDNCFGEPGINTHYVALGYRVHVPEEISINPDDQHSELKWWKREDLLSDPEVHGNTVHYFTGDKS